MSEVTFAKQFLATLDKRPIKLPADHAADPRKYDSQSPYILPKQTHPFPRKERPAASQQAKEKTITATLKPMRGGGETVTLPDTILDTSIHDLKAQYAEKTDHPQDKIKLLLNKKPAADLKTLKELGVSGDVELSVMIMGAGAATPSATTPAVEKVDPVMPSTEKMDIDSETPAPPSEKAQMEVDEKTSPADTVASIIQTEEFWTDLKGFLSQRLRDQQEGEKLAQVFREAWSKR